MPRTMTRCVYSAKSMPVRVSSGRVYTTGEAARLLHASQQTVIRAIDAGVIAGFRLPGSRHRRVTEAGLRAALTAAGLPLPPEMLPPDLTA